uniref:Uncharacterized protein n=1 Tax=Rhizophora mucronata TaxID=61149 RepID=A0A2P2QTA5_RHIMU
MPLAVHLASEANLGTPQQKGTKLVLIIIILH